MMKICKLIFLILMATTFSSYTYADSEEARHDSGNRMRAHVHSFFYTFYQCAKTAQWHPEGYEFDGVVSKELEIPSALDQDLYILNKNFDDLQEKIAFQKRIEEFYYAQKKPSSTRNTMSSLSSDNNEIKKPTINSSILDLNLQTGHMNFLYASGTPEKPVFTNPYMRWTKCSDIYAYRPFWDIDSKEETVLKATEARYEGLVLKAQECQVRGDKACLKKISQEAEAHEKNKVSENYNRFLKENDIQTEVFMGFSFVKKLSDQMISEIENKNSSGDSDSSASELYEKLSLHNYLYVFKQCVRTASWVKEGIESSRYGFSVLDLDLTKGNINSLYAQGTEKNPKFVAPYINDSCQAALSLGSENEMKMEKEALLLLAIQVRYEALNDKIHECQNGSENKEIKQKKACFQGVFDEASAHEKNKMSQKFLEYEKTRELNLDPFVGFKYIISLARMAIQSLEDEESMRGSSGIIISE